MPVLRGTRLWFGLALAVGTAVCHYFTGERPEFRQRGGGIVRYPSELSALFNAGDNAGARLLLAAKIALICHCSRGNRIRRDSSPLPPMSHAMRKFAWLLVGADALVTELARYRGQFDVGLAAAVIMSRRESVLSWRGNFQRREHPHLYLRR